MGEEDLIKLRKKVDEDFEDYRHGRSDGLAGKEKIKDTPGYNYGYIIGQSQAVFGEKEEIIEVVVNEPTSNISREEAVRRFGEEAVKKAESFAARDQMYENDSKPKSR